MSFAQASDCCLCLLLKRANLLPSNVDFIGTSKQEKDWQTALTQFHHLTISLATLHCGANRFGWLYIKQAIFNLPVPALRCIHVTSSACAAEEKINTFAFTNRLMLALTSGARVTGPHIFGTHVMLMLFTVCSSPSISLTNCCHRVGTFSAMKMLPKL